GWTASYWLKHLTNITAATRPYDGFWMKSGYRIPVAKFPLVERFISQETATNTPITEILVNLLITSPQDGARIHARDRVAISGNAWDGGYGIRSVEISADNGKTWAQARLGEDLGKFAFRPWTYDVTPKVRGKLVVAARATNQLGQTQTEKPIQNPSGSIYNAIQIVTLDVD